MKSGTQGGLGKSFFVISIVFMSLLLIGCGVGDQSDGKRTGVEASEGGYQTEQMPEITKDGIRRLSVKKEGKRVFELLYNPQESKNDFEAWSMTVPYEDKVIVDTAKMFLLFDKIESLSFTEAGEKAGVSEADINQQDKKTIIEIDYVKEGGQELYTCSFGIEADSRDGHYLAEAENLAATYVLPKDVVDELLTLEPFDYILRLAFISNIDAVREIEINAGQKSYQIKSEDGKYCFGQKKVSEEEFRALYSELMSVLIQKEIGAEAKDSESQKPLLEITYQHNSGTLEDKIIKFLPYDEEYGRIQVDGTEFFLVNKEDINQLILKIEDNFE